MKKLILLLLFIPLVFSCVNTNEIIEKDKIEISSTEKNLKPIYVLDGIQINNIDTISPSSISEIFVLKGQKEMCEREPESILCKEEEVDE